MKSIKILLVMILPLLTLYILLPSPAIADAPITVTIHDESQLAPGVFIFDMHNLGGQPPQVTIMLDNKGRQLLNLPLYLDVKRYKESYTGISSEQNRVAYRWDGVFGPIDQWRPVGFAGIDEHEFFLTETGEAWYMVYDTRPPTAAEISVGVPATSTFVSTIIQAQDADRNLIFEWRDVDHIDITQSLLPLDAETVDPCHGNSIAFDFDGDILVSCRHIGLLKIDRDTGAVIWQLAGNENDFSGFTDIGFQHDFRPLLLEGATNTRERGVYGLFDNHQSRGLVLEINQATMVVTATQAITAAEQTASFATGSFEQLPNGNFLICWGTNPLIGPSLGEPSISDLAVTEFNAAGEPLLDVRFNVPSLCYRARKMERVEFMEYWLPEVLK